MAVTLQLSIFNIVIDDSTVINEQFVRDCNPEIILNGVQVGIPLLIDDYKILESLGTKQHLDNSAVLNFLLFCHFIAIQIPNDNHPCLISANNISIVSRNSH